MLILKLIIIPILYIGFYIGFKVFKKGYEWREMRKFRREYRDE